MKVVFKVDDVVAALQPISQVINRKNTMPILDNVHLSISGLDNVIRLTGSDLETQLTIPAPIIETDKENAEICVNAVLFNQILSKLKGRILTLETTQSERILSGKYEGGTFELALEPTAEYPYLDVIPQEGANEVVFNTSGIIEESIKSTIIATANDEIRPVMCGVYFNFTEDGFTCVATDGRLLVKRVDKTIKSGATQGFILGKKPATILRTITSGFENPMPINVRFTDKSVMFFNDSFTMTCRLIEGRYPNYNSVIPTTVTEQVYISRIALIDTLSRVAVFSPTSELVVLDFKTNTVEVACQDVDYSMSGKETLRCAYEGTGIRIGFKHSYLDALLRNITTDDVVFKMTDKSHAAIVEPFNAGDENVELVSLIMPMVVD